MLNQIKQQLQSRQHAGRLLGQKLLSQIHLSPETIVLAIPQGGIPVGYEMASLLGVPFDIIFSKRIRHPANSNLSIGAVSINEVVLHESTQFIPQSYVLNQINLLQRTLLEEFRRYYGNKSRKNVKGKTVVVVDDVLRDVDELQASLQTLEQQQPHAIVFAAPVVNIRAINFLKEENYDVHYLFNEVSQQSHAYTYFPEMSEIETLAYFKSEAINR